MKKKFHYKSKHVPEQCLVPISRSWAHHSTAQHTAAQRGTARAVHCTALSWRASYEKEVKCAVPQGHQYTHSSKHNPNRAPKQGGRPLTASSRTTYKQQRLGPPELEQGRPDPADSIIFSRQIHLLPQASHWQDHTQQTPTCPMQQTHT